MNEPKMVYFAGKVSKGGGYRGKLFNEPRVMSLGHQIYEVNGGKVVYGGPFALANDHGTCHQMPHGLVDCSGGHSGLDGWMDGWDSSVWDGKNGVGVWSKLAVAKCFDQITDCDAVHCFLETISCYGTLVELGFAASRYKPIYIFYKDKAQNWYKHFWFSMNLPTVKSCGPGTETSIHPDLLAPLKSYKERYHEYLQSEAWNVIRTTKLQEAGYRCQLCNEAGRLNVHHRTYTRVFHEELSDLIALCEPCHQKFHNIDGVQK
jgi:hypothetical protein